jgi:hypothetical protein
MLEAGCYLVGVDCQSTLQEKSIKEIIYQFFQVIRNFNGAIQRRFGQFSWYNLGGCLIVYVPLTRDFATGNPWRAVADILSLDDGEIHFW